MLHNPLNPKSLWHSFLKSVSPSRQRRACRRQTSSNIAGIVEILETRQVLTPIISTIAISPDGQHTAQVVTSGGSQSVIEDGSTVAGSLQHVRELQFSPHGDHLAFISVNPQSQSNVYEDGHIVSGTFGAESGLRFSDDGAHLAFRVFNGQVNETTLVYNGIVSAPIRLYQSGLSVMEDGNLLNGIFVEVSPLQFTPSGHLIYEAETSGLMNATFKGFRDGVAVNSFSASNNLNDHIEAFTVSPDGLHTALIMKSDAVGSSIFDQSTVIEDEHLVIARNYISVQSLQFSATGDHLAFVGIRQDGGDPHSDVIKDGKVIRDDTLAVLFLQFNPVGDELYYVVLTPSGEEWLSEDAIYRGGYGNQQFENITDFQVSKAGHVAFIGYYDNDYSHTPMVFEDFTLLAEPAFQTVSSLQFSPDGQKLVFAATRRGQTDPQIWENGSVFHPEMQFSPGSITQLQFSPDSEHLAFVFCFLNDTGNGNAGDRVFEDNTEMASQLFGHVTNLTFSPVSNDMAFVAQDVGTTSTQVFLNGYAVGGAVGFVSMLQFSPNGSALAYVSNGSVLQNIVVVPNVTENSAAISKDATVLTINGLGFDPVATNNVVTFSNGITGTVLSSTTTQLKIGNLKHLQAGILKVVVTSHGNISGSPVTVATIVPTITSIAATANVTSSFDLAVRS